MRNLMEYANKAMQMLDGIHVPYSRNITAWRVNYNGGRAWGSCERTVCGNYTITINSVLLNEQNDEEGLMNTILHELLHTCKDCMKHTGEWKRYAEIVNYYLHYDIKRCSSADEKGVEVGYEIKPKVINYQFKCEGCGQTINRTRNSKFVQEYTNYRCGRCGGSFIQVK